MSVWSIEVDDTSFQLALTQLEMRLNDSALGIFLQGAVDPWLRLRAEKRFAGEGDDAVGAWSPLKYPTQNIRGSMGYGPSHPINKRTGILERYITNSAGNVGAAPGGVQLTFPGAQPTGNIYEKVLTAQAGRPSPKTVPRPVLGLSMTDSLFVQTSLVQYIETGTF